MTPALIGKLSFTQVPQLESMRPALLQQHTSIVPLTRISDASDGLFSMGHKNWCIGQVLLQAITDPQMIERMEEPRQEECMCFAILLPIIDTTKLLFRELAAKREAQEAQASSIRKVKSDLARRDAQLKDALACLSQVCKSAGHACL